MAALSCGVHVPCGLASLLSDNYLLLHAGAALAFFTADTGLTCCAFAGAGGRADTVVAGSESGVVHFLELPA